MTEQVILIKMNNKNERNYLSYATIAFLILFAVFAIFILIFIVGSIFQNDTQTEETKNVVAVEDSQQEEILESNEKTEEVLEKETVPPYTIYPAGTYKIGVDLPAGEYEVFAARYIKISSDSSGDIDSIIANENETVVNYISVNDGEYLTVKSLSGYNARIIPETEFPAVAFDTFSGGRYKIGKDIPAGEYKLTTTANGYWERDYYPLGNTFGEYNIIANDNFEDSTYVTVYDGEYLYLNPHTTLILNE